MINSTLLIGLTSLIVSLISLVNQLVLANLFGTRIEIDAYLIGTSAPMFVSGVLSASLGYSLVPVLVDKQKNEIKYQRFAGALFIGLAFFAVVIVTIGYILVPLQIRFLGRALSLTVSYEAVQIAKISWITAGLLIFTAYLSGLHNALNRFFLPVAITSTPYLGMMIGSILFGKSFGSLSIAWGMLMGALAGIAILLVKILSEIEISRKSWLLWSEVLKYFRRIPYLCLGVLSFTAFQIIDSYWAPLTGIGSLAELGYAQKLINAVGTLLIVGPSTALLPRLAQANAEGRNQDLLLDSLRVVKLVIIFSLPIAISMAVMSEAIIKLLFERGAFDSESTKGVAFVLSLMMPGMVAMLCVIIIYRAFNSKHEVKTTAVLGVILVLVYFNLSGLLSQSMGVGGIAIAYSLSWGVVLLIAILMLWRTNLNLIFGAKDRKLLWDILVLSLLTLAINFIAIEFIKVGTSNYILFTKISFTILIVFISNLFFSYKILKITDVKLIVDNVLNRFKNLYVNKKRDSMF